MSRTGIAAVTCAACALAFALAIGGCAGGAALSGASSAGTRTLEERAPQAAAAGSLTAPELPAEDKKLREEILNVVHRHLNAPGVSLLAEIDSAITRLIAARNERRAERELLRIEELEAEVERLRAALHAGTEGAAARPRRIKARAPLPGSPAFLGCAVQRVSKERLRDLRLADAAAVEVTSVFAGSPASQVGLRPGDVITELEGVAATSESFASVLGAKKPGDRIALRFVGKRDGTPVAYEARTLLADRAHFEERSEEAAENAEPATGGRSEAARDDGEQGPALLAAAAAGALASEGNEQVRLGATLRSRQFALEVTDLTPGGIAAEAGMRPGDRLLRLDGHRVRTIDGVKDALAQLAGRDLLTIHFLRDGHELIAELRIDLERGPGERLLNVARREFTGSEVEPHEVPAGQGDAAFLGVSLANEVDSLRIAEVLACSPAQEMGLCEGDLILAVNDDALANAGEMRDFLRHAHAGDPIRVSIRRGSVELSVQGVLASRGGAAGAGGEPQDRGAQERPAAGTTPAEEAAAGVGPAPAESANAAPSAPDPAGAEKPIPAAEDSARQRATEGSAAETGAAGAASPPPAEVAPKAAPLPAPPLKPRRFGITARLASGRVRIDKVDPRGSAAAAGLRAGDYITSIDERAIDSFADLESVIAEWEDGEELLVSIERNGQRETLCVPSAAAATGDAAPANPAAQGAEPAAEVAVPESPERKAGVEEGADGSAERAKSAGALPPRLGLVLRPIAGTFRVEQVEAGGPADRAGLRAGDEIVAVGDRLPGDLNQFRQLLSQCRAGDTLALRVRRTGENQELAIDVVLGNAR
ncbi:MAG: PDZ domain-containing protein [Planctomycetes bacterium]|nr:PDZ domain-containing protein [Planctomycetota bacterium]